jgi:hypothetical protein
MLSFPPTTPTNVVLPPDDTSDEDSDEDALAL